MTSKPNMAPEANLSAHNKSDIAHKSDAAKPATTETPRADDAKTTAPGEKPTDAGQHALKVNSAL